MKILRLEVYIIKWGSSEFGMGFNSTIGPEQGEIITYAQTFEGLLLQDKWNCTTL